MKAAGRQRGYGVHLAGAMRWVRRRVRLVHHVLSGGRAAAAAVGRRLFRLHTS